MCSLGSLVSTSCVISLEADWRFDLSCLSFMLYNWKWIIFPLELTDSWTNQAINMDKGAGPPSVLMAKGCVGQCLGAAARYSWPGHSSSVLLLPCHLTHSPATSLFFLPESLLGTQTLSDPVLLFKGLNSPLCK